MRSAIYYPHTQFQSEEILKTSLLLWDRVHFLVPYGGMGVYGQPALVAEAYELFAERRVPSDDEKLRAHRFVEDFIKRPLPPAFSVPPDDDSYIYSQKLLPATWEMLALSGLIKG